MKLLKLRDLCTSKYMNKFTELQIEYYVPVTTGV
jgi:hypothetical protein